MIKLSPPVSAALGEHAFETLMSLRGDVYRQQGARETARIVLQNHPYFIKRYHRDIFTHGAKSEWEGLRLCEKLGINAPVLKGFGARAMQSFVLMEAIQDADSLENAKPVGLEKRIIIQQLASIAKKLHTQGYYHRDFYLCHFFWNAPLEKLTVIDLHRLFKPAFFKKHYQEKDLSALLFSAMDNGLRQRDVFLFLKHYFNMGLRDIFKKHHDLLKSCERKAILLYQKAHHHKPRHLNWLAHETHWPDRVGPFHHVFSIDGKIFESETCLRVLNNRRMVLDGMYDHQRVIVKFFKDKKEFDREKTPDFLDAIVRPLKKGILSDLFFVMYPFIPGHPPKTFSPALLQAFLELHHHDFIQTDPHLDNFRISGDKVFILDPASIQHTTSENKKWDNLALLFAQWPIRFDQEHLMLLPEKIRNMLIQRIAKVRAYTSRKWLSKICRNSSEFYAKSRYYIRIYAKRQFLNIFSQSLMRFPESYFQESSVYLKNGTSSIVIKTNIGNNDIVIKRYNLKTVLNFIKGIFRGSKAKRAWKNTHLFLSLGIQTPEPLMMIEKRFFYIPLHSYSVTRFVSGASLDKMDFNALSPQVVQEIMRQIKEVFYIFELAHCYHGDLKASNWIWDGKNIQLIDLDSLKVIRKKVVFEKFHEKDKERFLRNFDVTHPLNKFPL